MTKLYLSSTVLLAWVCCILTGPSAIEATAACSMVEPFAGQDFSNVLTLEACQQKCFDATTPGCQSVMYSTESRRCILSANKRSVPLMPCCGFKYYEIANSCESPETVPETDSGNTIDITSSITSCTATSSYSNDFRCQYAYQGTEGPAGPQTEWAMVVGKGVGESMTVNFDRTYTVTTVKIAHRCLTTSQVSGWRLEMENGQSSEFTRSCGGTSNAWVCTGPGNEYFVMDLPANTRTSWIKFVITASCGTVALGIRDLRIMGRAG